MEGILDQAVIDLRSRSIVMRFFLIVYTRPISLFLFFFNFTFDLCTIIVILYLMYFIH